MKIIKKLIAILIILSFGAPVQAGMVKVYDPVEQELIQTQQSEQDISREFKKQVEEPVKPVMSVQTEESGQKSNWWKWTLGILLGLAVVGGIAAAAGGGGGDSAPASSGGSPSGSTSGGTGSIASTW
jgi:hypothetical protein